MSAAGAAPVRSRAEASTTSAPTPRPRRWLSALGAAPVPAAGREGEARHLAGKEAGGRRRMQGGAGSAADEERGREREGKRR